MNRCGKVLWGHCGASSRKIRRMRSRPAAWDQLRATLTGGKLTDRRIRDKHRATGQVASTTGTALVVCRIMTWRNARRDLTQTRDTLKTRQWVIGDWQNSPCSSRITGVSRRVQPQMRHRGIRPLSSSKPVGCRGVMDSQMRSRLPDHRIRGVKRTRSSCVVSSNRKIRRMRSRPAAWDRAAN